MGQLNWHYDIDDEVLISLPALTEMKLGHSEGTVIGRRRGAMGLEYEVELPNGLTHWFPFWYLTRA